MDTGAAAAGQVLQYLPERIKARLTYVEAALWEGLEEVRMRVGRPLLFKMSDGEKTVAQDKLTGDIIQGYRVTREDIQRTLEAISAHSVYAFEEEIRQGYITVPGGHRVGLAGQAVMQGEILSAVKHFNALSLRVARQCPGCAAGLYETIFACREQAGSVLIVSPPRCGKTTILRDLIRLLSNGLNREGLTVSLVDERSEIAGMYQGIPQLDVGLRTDVLDGYPKALGMMMAIRALSPAILATDEIGRAEDIRAVEEGVHAGVAILTTVHGGGVDEIRRRPGLRALLEEGVFQHIVLLSRQRGPGTVEDVIRRDAYAAH
jgi:stage III sporulation protein AA